MSFSLTPENAAQYLVDHGVVSPNVGRSAIAEFLGGGVSNVVIKVAWGDG